MLGFLTFFHIAVCLLLVTTILLQAGKGGGLAEGFSSAESLLGTQTNMVMVKITGVLTVLFLATSLGLTLLSSSKERSLMMRIPGQTSAQTVDVETLFDQEPAETITINMDAPAPEAPAAAE